MIFGHGFSLVGFGLILMVLGTSSLLAQTATGTGGGPGTAVSGRAVGSLGFTPMIAPFGTVGGNFRSMVPGFRSGARPFTSFYRNTFRQLPGTFAPVTNGFQSMVPNFAPVAPVFDRTIPAFGPAVPPFTQQTNVPFSQFYQNTFGQLNHPFEDFYQNSFGVTLPSFEATTPPTTTTITTPVTPNFGATSPQFQALYGLTP